MEHGQLIEALPLLTNYVAAKPHSLDAWTMLRQLHLRQNDTKEYLEAIAKTCALHLKAHEIEAAFQDYADFIDGGGSKMPAAVWLELCKGAEELQDFERAFAEYQHLAESYPSRPPGTNRATKRRPPLPQAPEPPAGCSRHLSVRGSVADPASGLGTAHPVRNQRSQNCHVPRNGKRRRRPIILKIQAKQVQPCRICFAPAIYVAMAT